MKKTILYLTVITMSLLTSCYNFLGPCIEGSGSIIEETREVSDFYSVSNTTSFDVYVTQADTFSVKVVAQQSLLPVIETYTSGGTLIIKTKEFTCVRSTSPVEIYVSLPEVEELHLTGSGKMICERLDGDLVELSLTSSGRMIVDTVICNELNIRHTASGGVESVQLEADYVELKLSGSGSLDFGDMFVNDIYVTHTSSGTVRGGIHEAQKTDLTLTGSGRIILYGDTEQLACSHTSSGRIDALDLVSGDVVTHSTGSGNTYVNVSGVLEVTILGSGDVVYMGEPGEIIRRVTGSGNVRPY